MKNSEKYDIIVHINRSLVNSVPRYQIMDTFTGQLVSPKFSGIKELQEWFDMNLRETEVENEVSRKKRKG